MEERDMTSSELLKARKKLVEEHMRAENAHDITATMATLGRQPRYILNGVSLDGSEEIRAAYESIGLGKAAAFARFKVDVTGLHTGEEAIILEGMMSGTHVAEWQGVPATGRSFHIPVCAVFTFDAEEKLAGERIYFDSGLLLKQLGVLS
jgi:steroid delta-isomerase-like uncharacterized protein